MYTNNLPHFPKTKQNKRLKKMTVVWNPIFIKISIYLLKTYLHRWNYGRYAVLPYIFLLSDITCLFFHINTCRSFLKLCFFNWSRVDPKCYISFTCTAYKFIHYAVFTASVATIVTIWCCYTITDYILFDFLPGDLFFP